jgi:hypothetical protein
MNLQAQAMTRAHQVATNRVKDEIRSDGRKLSSIAAHELRCSIKRYLNEHPEVLERAAMEVASWKKGRRFRARQAPDFWALLTTIPDAE